MACRRCCGLLNSYVAMLGADLNEVPGYVQAKHTFTGLKTDDWIALDEGSWFYMPSLYPAASFSQAMEVLQTQDALIKEIPEVANVLGKIGRVDSALDPAPAAMVETYVMLKPQSQWREGMTARKIWDEINRVATLPGVTPASPLQPIEGRVVMLQSGIKASMAVRDYGDSLEGLAKASLAVAEHLKNTPLVNAGTVNPDIVMGKPYYEFEVDREEAARYGMTTHDGQPDRLGGPGRRGCDDHRGRPRTLSDPDPLPTQRAGTTRRTAQGARRHAFRRSRAAGATGPGRRRPGGRGRSTAKMPDWWPMSRFPRRASPATWKRWMR